MDQQPKLPRILMVLTYAIATLYAVAASKFDLTGEPYDLIIRVSLQKPAWMRRAYWPGTARHYRVAVMTRASQQALSVPGICPPHSVSDTKEHRRSTLINDPPMNAFTHAEALDLRLQCNQRPRSFVCSLQIWCRNKSRAPGH